MNREHSNRGRDQYNFEKLQGNFVVENREQPTRPHSEFLLLQQVKREVVSRLEQSLHNKVLIILSKQKQPKQVKRLWDVEVKIGSKPTEPLLPQTSILEVFERAEIGGQLLLLGNPGAGKTTTMLDLGQSLIDKATQDSNYPIPVLFNLSSWKDPRQSIPNWLIEELQSKYGVRRSIGKKFVEEKLLLPMLDGLDEIKPEHQETCVDFLNQWFQGDERPLYVVVCSRWEEYANYQTRLHLNGAILLKKLTDGQIQKYLSDVARAELWQLLQQNPGLLELLRTPLLLSIMVLSYKDLPLKKWHELTSEDQRLKLLWDTYIQNRFNWNLESETYRKFTPPKAVQTRYWLIFLAQQLQRESQTDFLIEKIQPSWLVTNEQTKAHRLAMGLIFALIGGLSSGLIGMSSRFGLGFGLIYGLGFGLMYGLIGALGNDPEWESEIKLFETFKWNLSFKKAKLSLIFGLIFGLIIGLIDGLIMGLIYGLFNGLFFGLIIGLIGSEVDTKRRPNQGIWKSAINALFFVLIYGLPVGLHSGLVFGLGYGLCFGLISGAGKAATRHLALRLSLCQSGSIPWNYARFLNYCTELSFLQRVGGRYRFIHEQLQDHFAEMLIDTTVKE